MEVNGQDISRTWKQKCNAYFVKGRGQWWPNGWSDW